MNKVILGLLIEKGKQRCLPFFYAYCDYISSWLIFVLMITEISKIDEERLQRFLCQMNCLVGDSIRTIAGIIEEKDGRLIQRDIVEECDMTQSAISQFLTKMENCGLITRKKVGRSSKITLTDAYYDVVATLISK